MSCLLPQFKCQPDTFYVQFRSHNHHHHPPAPAYTRLPKSRESIYFRAQCSLSTTLPSTTSTAVLDMERLRLLSLEVHSESVTANKPWTYIGSIGPPMQENLEATLAAETLFTNEEAGITAAAAEAVALARAAAKVAKETVMMANNYHAEETKSKPTIPPITDAFLFKWAQLRETEQNGLVVDSLASVKGAGVDDSARYSSKEFDDLEPTYEELELLQEQISKSIAVRSSRQTERKARRVRAAEKAAANVVTVKSGSTSRKKRASLKGVNRSDPLGYLRGTTGTYRLLSVTEEAKLSEGIQDLMKLERLQVELAGRFGDKPTLAQWAAAAGVDQKTLRKCLNYGVHCRDKMMKSNIRLVISIAKNFQGFGMELPDLVQEGCRGLLRASEKFDSSKGFKFSTYAHWWIKQAVRKSLTEHTRIIRIPSHMVTEIRRVNEVRKQLYNENRAIPNDEEIAKAAGISMKRLTDLRLVPKTTISLDQKTGFDGNLTLSDTIASPDTETSQDYMMKQAVWSMLDSLSPRDNLVLRMRFGLDDGRGKTLQEIGNTFGLSRERIRQIELSVFEKLKEKEDIKYLQRYLHS